MKKNIKLTSVGHHFGAGEHKVSLFNQLCLSVKTNEATAIVGPSGIGKSSLLMLLAGLESPTSGKVEYLVDEEKQSLLALKQCSGFIFQQFHLMTELNAINNIALPLKLKGDADAMDKAYHWLRQVGLEKRATHKPSQLSGGEQQRIAIARAFVSDPDFIFADEPTGNLDEKTAAEITELMFACKQTNNAGLVIVTHSKRLASRADHVYLLKNKSLVKEHMSAGVLS